MTTKLMSADLAKKVGAIFARRRHPLIFLSFIGPGLIAAAAGNDAGGIATYSIAGARFGYKLLWIMLPLTLGFTLVQEMSARLGAATGKGFSDLVREQFSIRATVAMMFMLLIGNAGLVVSEFAGIAAALELFGISKYIGVPIAALFVWLLITRGSYHKVEKVFLLMSSALLGYIVAAFLAKPNWGEVATHLFVPSFTFNHEYLKYTLALIGTTIAPFMQVYAQSSVVEKGITMSDYKYEMVDTAIGTVLANMIAVFIIVATATTLFPVGIAITTAGEAAQALAPFAGSFATILFGVGLLGASLVAAGVVPLTTSFALSNAFGWESGVNRKLEEAPLFYAVFTFLIVLAATIILSPAISLINLLVSLQLINGFLLPIQLVYMIILANNKSIMGRHTNSRLFNIGIITTAVLVSLASIAYLVSLFI